MSASETQSFTFSESSKNEAKTKLEDPSESAASSFTKSGSRKCSEELIETLESFEDKHGLE